MDYIINSWITLLRAEESKEMLEKIETIGHSNLINEQQIFHYEQDEILAQELQNNILIHLAGGHSKILAEEMFLEGLIILENKSDLITVKNILCDSGALHGSYISKRFLAKIRNDLGPHHIKKVNSDVRLGDNKTIVSIDEVAILEIMITLEDSFEGSGPKEFTIQEIFSVIETGPDIIFGLPTIIRFIPDLFKKMVDKACSSTLKILDKLNDSSLDQ